MGDALRLALAVVLVLAAGCGGAGGRADAAGEADAAADTAWDLDQAAPDEATSEADALPPADALDAEAAEFAGDDPSANACPDVALEETFQLFPAEATPQLHPAVAFDGEAFWVTWTGPGAGNDLDTWAARVQCDGTYAVAPFRVAVHDQGNDVDPDVAVSGASVLIAWTVDTGGNPNLFLPYRALGVDGSPVMAAEANWVPQVAGKPSTDGVWEPRLATMPGGGFVLAASRSSPETLRFQAVVGRIGTDGKPLADAATGTPVDAIVPLVENGVSQDEPVVAADAAGGLWVAWTREPDAGDTSVQVARIEPGATTAGTPVAVAGGAAAANPWLAAGPDGVLLGYTGPTAAKDVQVLVLPADGSNAPAVFGGKDTEFAPVVATNPGGGALLWYRLRSGYQCDLLLQGFMVAGGAVIPRGQATVLNPPETGDEHAAASVYLPALVHVRDHVFLAVWPEGKSPAFKLQARFVEVE